MKTRSLLILGVVTVVLIGAALWMSGQQERTSAPMERLFPGLLEAVNDVSEFRISARDGTSTILRRGDIWGVKEKHHYPADLGKVREVLIGLAELQILEAKTAKPERYEKLGLQDIDVEGSGSTEVVLKDAEGQSVAEVIVGHSLPSSGRPGARGLPLQWEIYARKPGNPQTWLTLGNFPVDHNPDRWIDKDFLDIEPARVRRVSIVHPDGTRLTVEKEKPGDLDYHVADLPEGRVVQSQFTVNNIVSTIASLSLDDVHPESDIAFAGEGVTAAVETFDGFEGTVTVHQQDAKNYVTVSAAFNEALIWQPEPGELAAQPADGPEASEPEESAEQSVDGQEASEPEEPSDQPTDGPQAPDQEQAATTAETPTIKPAEEVRAEVEALVKTVSGWVYVIPQSRADPILTKPESLLAPPAQQ